jgi:hypothetical protein
MKKGYELFPSNVTQERMVITLTTTTETEWKRIPTTWQLPCGCIGPDIWSCDSVEQSHCTECGRGWHWMGNFGFCRMLDGGRQGEPVLILKEEWIEKEAA